MDESFFIFGFGYTAYYLALQLAKQGINVIGTTRDEKRCAIQENPAYTLINFADQNEVKRALLRSTSVLISTPPNAQGDPVIDHYAKELIKHQPHFKWIGYLSSTGVYGDHDGAWVDEETPTQPQGASAATRSLAEQAWRKLTQVDLPIHLFRLAGIYGPFRNNLSSIINGKSMSIYKAGQYFSRIHVADIVNILLASMKTPNPGAIYNVADDLPAPAHEVDQFATQLLQRDPLPLISFTEASLSPMAKSFYQANRRVSNNKIKRELSINLNYPTYQQGLTQLFLNKEY